MPNYRDTSYHVNFLAGTSGIMGNPGARIFYVGASGYTAVNGTAPSDSNNGLSPQTPFATIQKGLDSVTAGRGDTVAILPGEYTITAALTMTNADVTLCSAIPVGPKRESPVVITAAATYDLNMVQIDADNCKVMGIQFDCGFGTVTANQEIIQINSTNTTTSIYGAVIENCFFDCTDPGTIDTDCDVIRVGLDANDAAISTVIRGCVIKGYDQDAIAVTGGSINCLIEDCYIYDGVASDLGRNGVVTAALDTHVDNCRILTGTSSDTVACVAVNVAAARAVITNCFMMAWGANTCTITSIDTATLFSMGNWLGAAAAGNLIDYKTAVTSPSTNVDIGAVYAAAGSTSANVNPTLDAT